VFLLSLFSIIALCPTAAVAADAALPGLLIEPLYPKLARWEVAVLSSAEDGPVALLPAEVEQYSPLHELADADLALQEWQMMQVGRLAGELWRMAEKALPEKLARVRKQHQHVMAYCVSSCHRCT
jgi:hypothetical protein